MFVDQVDIHVKAGDGGRGCVSFRREKFVARGGPNGGDGGRGGSVHLRASLHRNTLVDYRFHREFSARRGAHGEGSSRTGRAGADLTLDVPVGTIVYRLDDERLVRLADLAAPDSRVIVARGGLGGRGNERFATSTNRAPRRAEPGGAGQDCRLRLSLKLLADVGLVGFPNVGKSTLISRLSAARPKIADYPFTTLTPHLGVVRIDDERSYVLADVPGLIEGAHDGHGLGLRFLSHLERTKILVHIIDVSSATGRNPAEDFEIVCRELASYAGSASEPALPDTAQLGAKPQIVAANKVDVLDDPARLAALQRSLAARSVAMYPISAVTGDGLGALQEAVWRQLAAADGAHGDTAQAEAT
ncbi:MAG: GTPase ObgE [Acidobacteria bacterium]|nr:GTPase ObgE [Acidobacteriota bacterium]